MGIEHFYWFIDREVVDPVLEMSWKAFLRKYPWDRDDVDEVLNFAVEGEPETAAITGILEKRSLRWTIKRSSSAYLLALKCNRSPRARTHAEVSRGLAV